MARTSCSQLTLRQDKRSRFPSHSAAGALSYNLDTNGLAEAAAVLSQALRNKIDLLVINKFAKQEADGRALRAEFVGPISTDSRCRNSLPTGEASPRAVARYRL